MEANSSPVPDRIVVGADRGYSEQFFGAQPKERLPETRESEVGGQKSGRQVTGSKGQNLEASQQSIANLKRRGGMARVLRLRRAARSAETMAGNRKQRRKHQERIAEVDEAAIRLHIEPLEQGGYVATSPDIPGLVAEGRSVTETVEIAQELTRKIVESCLEHGDPLPRALSKLRRAPLNLRIPVGIR
jgi:antitoxin HicB